MSAEPEPELAEGAPQGAGAGPAEDESSRLVREYTRYGISLPGLLHIAQMFPSITDEHTTSDVCQTVIKPHTLPDGWRTRPELTDATNRYYRHTYFPVPESGGAGGGGEGAPQPTALPGTKSMCQVMEEEPTTQHFVGRPTHFLSHAWVFLFLNVLSGLQNFVAQLPADEPEPFFWFDCFVLDQHAQSSQGADWWRTTFMLAIGGIGHTVMMLSPWSSPVPLTRSWCLWELYCSHQTEARFSVCLGTGEQEAFREAIVQDSGVVLEAFAKIDVRAAEAGSPADRERILSAVEETVGSVRLNAIAIQELRQWIVGEARGLLRSASVSGRIEISALFRKLDLLAEAQQIAEEAVQSAEAGSYDLGVAGTNLATVYSKQGDYPKALEYYQKALDIKVASVGEQHMSVGNTYKNMANVYRKQGDYPKALEYYQKALDISRQTHGERYTAWFEAQIARVTE